MASARIEIKSNGSGARCHWCRRVMLDPSVYSVLCATKDHVIPKSRGGTVKVWCCWTCNQIKGDKHPGEWARFMLDNPRWWNALMKPPQRPCELEGYGIGANPDLRTALRPSRSEPGPNADAAVTSESSTLPLSSSSEAEG